MIDTWLELKKITPDSLVFRALKVGEDRKILLDDEASQVYMTYYSDEFRKKHSAESLKKMALPTS
jgi:hypothetical protein